MKFLFRDVFSGLTLCWFSLIGTLSASSSTYLTLEKAQQMYQENPTTENWEQLLAMKSQARFNEAYPYLLVGLIFIYVMMRMIFSNKIKKS